MTMNQQNRPETTPIFTATEREAIRQANYQATEPVTAPIKQAPQPAAKPVKQARDRAQYVRQQKGHSLILHLTLGALALWIPALYITISPNHYWHA